MGDYQLFRRVYPEYSEGGYNESCLRKPGQRETQPGSQCQAGLTCQIGNTRTPKCLPSTVSQPPVDAKERVNLGWGARRDPRDQICSVSRTINGRATRIMVPDEYCGKRLVSARDGGAFRESTLCNPDCRLVYDQDTGRFLTGRIVTLPVAGVQNGDYQAPGGRVIRRFVPCHPSCAEQPPPWMEFEHKKKAGSGWT